MQTAALREGSWAAATRLKTFQFQEIPVGDENFWAVTMQSSKENRVDSVGLR